MTTKNVNGMENTDVKTFVKKAKTEAPKTPEEVPAEKKEDKPAEQPVVLKVE